MTTQPFFGPARRLTPAKKMEYGWLCLIAVLFLVQVLPYLSRRWVTDESWYSAPGYSLAQGHGMRDPAIGPNDLENRFDARPPGTALAIAASFRIFGAGPTAARLGSVVAGLLLLGMVYRLTRNVLGWEGAALATLLTATDNLVVLAARTARPEALTTMAIVLSLLLLKRYTKGGSLAWAFATGLAMAMAAMFHISVLGYIVSCGLLTMAIDIRHGTSALRGTLVYAGGFLAGLIPFSAWILLSPLGRAGFQQEYMSRAVNSPVWARMLDEGRRYYDILGLHTTHIRGLENLPIRLPIPLCFLAASALLWRFRRRWFYVELVLVVPSIIWLAYTVNKSSRYIAILAPVFAVTIAAGVQAVRGRRLLYRIALTITGLLIAAQAGANFILLRAAGKANYEKVEAELRRLIPPSETAYGSMVFWLGLREQPFISYERTGPWMAARDDHARYFIVGDRVMIDGLPGDSDFYEQLRRELAEIAAHSTMVGHVVDPYYGELQVYRLDR